MDWIELAQDVDRWQALVNRVMKIRVPGNAGNFLTSLKPVSFSRRTLFHGRSKYKRYDIPRFMIYRIISIVNMLLRNPGRIAGGRTVRSEIHKLFNSSWNTEKLSEARKESIIVPIYKKGDKTDCNRYRGISLSPTTFKILSNILPSSLTPYAEEVIGDHQCGYRRNRSTKDHIFRIRQILGEKMGIK